jgi:hypothetical protein
MIVEKVPAINMNPSARFPSTWRESKGKPLTDKAIEKYRRQGRYAEFLKLPPKLGKPCVKCGTREETTKRSYAYLPVAGHYCDKCLDSFRDERDKAKEFRARIRALRETEYE